MYFQQHMTKKRKFESTKGGGDLAEVNGCKVILFPSGAVKSNQTIVDLLKLIKPYVIHFLDSSAVVKIAKTSLF